MNGYRALLYLSFIFTVWSCGSNPDTLLKEGNEAAKSGDYERALSLYEKSCSLGSGAACFYAANICNESDIYLSFMIKSCNLSFADACLALGNLYAAGFNDNFMVFKKNADESLKYFEKACELSAALCSSAGDMYIGGDIIAQNYEKAVLYYDKACAAGDKTECDKTKDIRENADFKR